MCDNILLTSEIHFHNRVHAEFWTKANKNAKILFVYISLPVRIFWKAASTLVESNAEVSINDNSFFSEKKIRNKSIYLIPNKC